MLNKWLSMSTVALVLVLVVNCCVSPVSADVDPTTLYVSNPFMVGIGGNLVAADPDVFLIETGPMSPYYILTHTQQNSGGSDFPIYVSKDLVQWTLHSQAFNVTTSTDPNAAVQLGEYYYCGCWAPEIRPAGHMAGIWALSFTASRFDVPTPQCPGYDEGSGVFMAYSDSPLGPFVAPNDFPQPIGATTDTTVCPQTVHDLLPQSQRVDTQNCGLTQCNNSIRLDGDLFNDPLTGDSWIAYAWYSNSQPLTAWDDVNLGEHVSLVKVDPMNPRQIPCDVSLATKVWAASPHDNVTLQQLGESCPRCEEMLSMVRGRQGQIVERENRVWGVTEGPMLFRRNGLVYLIISHSIWDSAYYAASWFAAPTVEELDITNGPQSTRLAGRLLIPSLDQSFGHGSAVRGPGVDSQGQPQWFYIHHHLNHSHCWNPTDICERDLFITPLIFEDRKDGRGQVWIQTQFPAENGRTAVIQPAATSPTNTDKSYLHKLAVITIILSFVLLVIFSIIFMMVRKRNSNNPSVDNILPYTDNRANTALLQQKYDFSD